MLVIIFPFRLRDGPMPGMPPQSRGGRGGGDGGKWQLGCKGRYTGYNPYTAALATYIPDPHSQLTIAAVYCTGVGGLGKSAAKVLVQAVQMRVRSDEERHWPLCPVYPPCLLTLLLSWHLSGSHIRSVFSPYPCSD